MAQHSAAKALRRFRPQSSYPLVFAAPTQAVVAQLLAQSVRDEVVPTRESNANRHPIYGVLSRLRRGTLMKGWTTVGADGRVEEGGS